MLGAVADRVFSVVRRARLEGTLRDSSWRTHRLLVLCWHGISLDDEHQWRPGLYITPSLFRSRLQDLRDGKYNVLPLDDALERLWRGDLPPRSVAITFDDGFHDFAALAAPLLTEFQYPATVYLTTYYVDHRRPIFPLIVSYLLWKGRRSPAEADSEAVKIVEQARRELASGEDEADITTKLAAELDIDLASLARRGLLCLMSEQEVREVARNGLIRIEAHTHRHRTPQDLGLIRRELRDNGKRIEEITGRRPVHFCYPSGVFRREYFPVFEEEGFRSATTCELGIA